MMNRRIVGETTVRGPAALWLVLATGLAGCGQAPPGEEVVQESEALVVTNCTGAAIAAAIAAGGSIVLSCGANPITVKVPSTTVARSAQLSSMGSGRLTFAHTSTLFTVTGGATFSVSGIDFTGSQTLGFGPAFKVNPSAPGNIQVSGAVFRSYQNTFVMQLEQGASVSVTGCTFDRNTANSFGAPIYNEGANVTVRDSTFSNNTVNGGRGGAINQVVGTLTVSSSTFSSNMALGSGAHGGAIAVSGGTATITNCTFANNRASSLGAAILATNSVTKISYSTFANNTSPGLTLAGNPSVSSSIVVDPTSNGASCNLAGSSNLQWPAVTSLCGPGFRFADPKLGPLANNGGLTSTMSLGTGSAAIDSSSIACPPSGTDQRGVSRPRDGDGNGSLTCDIGAFER